MSRFQPFNDLPASQQEALKRDVEVRGIVNPILVDENDKTIDGHQRRKVAAELGIDCPRIVLTGLSDDEKMSLAIALNTFRRHLTGVERSKALQQMAQLGMSVRRIAEATGIPKSTVQRDISGVPCGTPDDECPTTEAEFVDRFGVRPDEAEALLAAGGDKAALDAMRMASETPMPEPRVTGKDGKSYPASKPVQPKTPEQQAEEDRQGQLRRAARRLEEFVNGWLEFQHFHSNPDRDEILALLIPEDRAVIFDVEARFMVGATNE